MNNSWKKKKRFTNRNNEDRKGRLVLLGCDSYWIEVFKHIDRRDTKEYNAASKTNDHKIENRVATEARDMLLDCKRVVTLRRVGLNVIFQRIVFRGRSFNPRSD